MPTYNVEKYFKQCIESIINQTLKDIEIIIVDDGSPDNCGKIMDEYAEKDTRIITIHKENGGYGSAVNAGLAIATGEYIGIVETDDWCEPTMFEKLYKKAKETDADIAKCYFNNPPSSNKKRKGEIEEFMRIAKNIENKDPKLLLLHCSIWSCIYRKSMLDKYCISMDNKPGSFYQDLLWKTETFINANKITYVPELLYNWRLEPKQKSSSNLKNAKLMNMIDITKKSILYAKQNNRNDILEYIYNYGLYVNLLFFNRITRNYKKQYFYKIKNLLMEAENDNFQYEFCDSQLKKQYKDFLKYNYVLFIVMGFLDRLKRFIFSKKIKNNRIRIKVLGIRIVNIRSKI